MLSFDELTAGQAALAFLPSMSNVKNMSTNTRTTSEANEYPASVLDLLFEANVITDLENAIGQCRTMGAALQGLAESGADEKEIINVSGAAAMTADFLKSTLYRITNLVEGIKLNQK